VKETQMPESLVATYLVALDTPKGRIELEVPTMLGPEGAARRGFWIARHQRWGEVDEIHVVSTELVK
jgi:hypothetical protein